MVTRRGEDYLGTLASGLPADATSCSEEEMSGMFLIHDNGDLVEMRESPYDSEALLQRLLAQYPNLLAGDQINAGKPRRWLLVTREMSVPGDLDGAGRWSLDHLFLDQEAIPTLVEVKRSSDTRIRREVVGQMLDYAANAVVYWPVEEIRAKFEATCSARQVDPDAEVSELVDKGIEVGEFWQKVKTNLQAGRVRMLFVADEIPPELRRVVEFLNEQMDPAEVLALEVRQFVGPGLKTLVPRVIGQTAVAEKKRSGGSSNRDKIGSDEFFTELSARNGPAEVRVVRRLVDWSASAGLEPDYTKGSRLSAFIPTLIRGGESLYPIAVRTSGHFILQMRWPVTKPPFNDEAKQAELLGKLNVIPGIGFTSERIKGMPSIPLSVLVNEAARDQLISVLRWLTDGLKAI
jgi:hypothetical protein